MSYSIHIIKYIQQKPLDMGLRLKELDMIYVIYECIKDSVLYNFSRFIFLSTKNINQLEYTNTSKSRFH